DKSESNVWRDGLGKSSLHQDAWPVDPNLLEKLGMKRGDRVFGFAGYLADWLVPLSQQGARLVYNDLDPVVVDWVRRHRSTEFRKEFEIRVGDPFIDPRRTNQYEWSFSFEPWPVCWGELPFVIIRSMLNRKGFMMVARLELGEGFA